MFDANYACGRANPLLTITESRGADFSGRRNNEPYSNVLDRSSRRNVSGQYVRSVPRNIHTETGVTVGLIVHVIPPVPMGNGANLRISWQKSRGIVDEYWQLFQVDIVSSRHRFKLLLSRIRSLIGLCWRLIGCVDRSFCGLINFFCVCFGGNC